MIVLILRWLATAFFAVSGVMHFVIPGFYRAMMPDLIPFKDFFIVLTGLAEIAGAAGIQFPLLRAHAGRWMIVLLIAIFPANLYVAIAQPELPGLDYTPESMWWRLLLQPVFIAWIWYVSRTVKSVGAPQS